MSGGREDSRPDSCYADNSDFAPPGDKKMCGAMLFLLLSGMSFILFMDSLQFEHRKVYFGYHSKQNKQIPSPYQYAVACPLFLLIGLLMLTGMTGPILRVLSAAAQVGTAAIEIAVIALFLLSFLAIISLLLFAAERMSVRKNDGSPKHPAPEKSKRKGKPKPKRKNDWLQRDSA